MSLVNGQFWYRWGNDCFLLTIISWGLLFHVDAWTYHYGAESDLSWKDARTFCQTWYTDLVAIQNKEEIAYLNDNLPKHSKYYWIGIRKINNIWTWVGTRKALTKEAENWAYREPNNRLSNQDCVEIYIKRDFEAGKWNDEPCGKKKRALCYKASCQPYSCNKRSECVETIGNYTCQCYPGFYGPLCENVVKCNTFGRLHQALLMNCIHPLEQFSYRSHCSFRCDKGFTMTGLDNLQCLSSGQWTAEVPQCAVMQCDHLQNPKNGEMACSHPFAEFAYQSTCQFACQPGFLLTGANTTFCLATRHWSSPLPACQAIECPNLDIPKNGELNCSHPHGRFAYNSSCAFSCDIGFVRIGTSQLQCTDLGKWSAATPSCEAVQCPPLKTPENGKENCSNPYGHFAYYSSCTFSCNSGFQLAGSEKLNCTDQGNWTGQTPICEAIKCPELQAPKNGQFKCSQSYGNFTYNSSCVFSCERGFKRIGSKRLNCTATGEWAGFAQFCEAIKCPPLKETENMKKNCSHPWGLFSYSSTCHFYCTEGFLLNGTSKMQCQPDGQWSTEMPVCQENAAIYLKQVLLYTGGVTASLVLFMIFGGLIALAIKRLSKREEKKKLLSHTSELGVPGTYSNSAFDSVS
ncbi:P-selectin-like [Pseudonaja textilis]|uniref:P-selectin-like n=1 Tax=Pseudonaja textilis TaxID=8673 RepID=UPI000EA99A84|nr:P-selectin-like [Pseudonaja textilis]